MESVIIRVEVEAIRHHMTHYIHTHADDLTRQVDAALDRFDWNAEVERIVQQELPAILRRSIATALQGAVDSSPAINASVSRTLRRALRASLTEEGP